VRPTDIAMVDVVWVFRHGEADGQILVQFDWRLGISLHSEADFWWPTWLHVAEVTFVHFTAWGPLLVPAGLSKIRKCWLSIEIQEWVQPFAPL